MRTGTRAPSDTPSTGGGDGQANDNDDAELEQFPVPSRLATRQLPLREKGPDTAGSAVLGNRHQQTGELPQRLVRSRVKPFLGFTNTGDDPSNMLAQPTVAMDRKRTVRRARLAFRTALSTS